MVSAAVVTLISYSPFGPGSAFLSQLVSVKILSELTCSGAGGLPQGKGTNASLSRGDLWIHPLQDAMCIPVESYVICQKDKIGLDM